MTITTTVAPVQGDIETLETVRNILQGCGGLLHGRYSSHKAGVPCYCIVGAVRQAVYDQDVRRSDNSSPTLRLCSLIDQTIHDFDPEGYEDLEAKLLEHYPDSDHDRSTGQTRLFIYNDHVLYGLPIDPEADFDKIDPDSAARLKAVKLLDATIERCKSLVEV
jgi:hypothetical protein